MKEFGTPAAAGRSVLVMGASRGIGRAIAERFSTAGDGVTAVARTLPDIPGALGFQADITSTTQVNAAFAAAEAAHGPVEVMVACAGITRDSLVMRLSDDDLSAVLETNLSGAIRCARRAVPGMVRLRRGRIIMIGSVIGLYGGPGQVNYAAAKAGLVGAVRSLTRELGGRGITANVVAPGFIDTDMTADLGQDLRERYLTAIPAGRFGSVEEVGDVVAFLASPAAAYISGAVIPVDGGLGMGH